MAKHKASVDYTKLPYVTRAGSVKYYQPVASPLGRMFLAGEHVDLDSAKLPPMPMRKWPIYSLVFVVKGEGKYVDIGGAREKIRSGDLMIMFAGRGYRYDISPACRWGEIYIQCDGPVFDLYRREGLLDPGKPVWHLEPVKYWADRLRQLMRPPDLPPAESALGRLCELLLFLCEAHAYHFSARQGANDSKWLVEAKAALNNEILKPKMNLKRVVRQLGISADRFRKKFRELAGQSLHAYCSARRIGHACALLHDPEIQVKKVAMACGFEDPYHFSRRFKQVMGIAPLDYRGLQHSKPKRKKR